MSISRKIVVERHGGSIDCQSKAGEGTTFVVRLPIEGKLLSAEEVAA